MGERRLTFSGYARRARMLAPALEGLAVRLQDRVAVFSTNSIEYFEVYGACEVTGFIAALYNFRSAAPELIYRLQDSERRVLLFEHTFAPLVEAVRGHFPEWAFPHRRVIDLRAAVACQFERQGAGACQFVLIPVDEGTAGPLFVEQILCIAPALIRLPDEVLRWNFHVVKEHLAEMGVAVDLVDPPDRESGRLQVDQQERQASLGLYVGIGPHDEEAPIGVLGATGPDLLPIHEVMVILANCTGSQRSQIRTGRRLGETLCP